MPAAMATSPRRCLDSPTVSLRPSRFARRGLAVVFGVTAALCAGEATYRLTRVAGLSPTSHPGYVQHDDELGWRYRPASRARHVSDEFDVAIEINPQGFRGAPWPARDSRPLVLVLGDSFAFGWGVEEPQSVAGQLRSAHPEWDVRNVGVSGYGTDQQWLLLARLNAELQPDAVVCIYCDNDRMECASNSAYGRMKPRFALQDGQLVLTDRPGAESWLDANCLLLRAVHKLRWQAGVRPLADWSLLHALFRAMRDAIAPARLVLVGNDDLLAESARELGVTILDTRTALDGKHTYHFARDRHWTAAGHRRVAESVSAALAGLTRSPRVPTSR